MKVDDIAILVGGRGKRIDKLTKSTPKPLIKFDQNLFLIKFYQKL